MKLFNEKFGDYPYDTYSVVQTKFVQGGMEFPSLVMISDSLEKEAYIEVIVHETAHQWWQTVVGNNEIEYGFLDEGLAEYSVVVFYENYPEYGMEREKLIAASEKTYKLYCSVFDKLFGKVDTKMVRRLNEFKGEYEYVNLAYVKPCIMYEYLRKTIGDEAFFKGLKRYYESYKFKNATPYDVVGIYEKQGKDTNGFFQSFFDGKVII
jgi:aminopeptidase N